MILILVVAVNQQILSSTEQGFIGLLGRKLLFQVLLNPSLCVVEGILSVAQMVKEIQQNLKQKFPTLFR